MLDTAHSTLRARLRKETAADHDRVDAMFSTLNLREPHGLSRFFAAHLVGFHAVRSAMGEREGWVGSQMVDDIRKALATDLKILGHTQLLPEVKVGSLSHHAIDHIVLGSRLGSAVLRRDWAESADPLVRTASTYFTLPTCADFWRAHCNEVTALPGDTDDANRVVSHARLLFQVFERAFNAIN